VLVLKSKPLRALAGRELPVRRMASQAPQAHRVTSATPGKHTQAGFGLVWWPTESPFVPPLPCRPLHAQGCAPLCGVLGLPIGSVHHWQDPWSPSAAWCPPCRMSPPRRAALPRAHARCWVLLWKPLPQNHRGEGENSGDLEKENNTQI